MIYPKLILLLCIPLTSHFTLSFFLKLRFLASFWYLHFPSQAPPLTKETKKWKTESSNKKMVKLWPTTSSSLSLPSFLQISASTAPTSVPYLVYLLAVWRVQTIWEGWHVWLCSMRDCTRRWRGKTRLADKVDSLLSVMETKWHITFLPHKQQPQHRFLFGHLPSFSFITIFWWNLSLLFYFIIIISFLLWWNLSLLFYYYYFIIIIFQV
jgi:hypothetical protein